MPIDRIKIYNPNGIITNNGKTKEKAWNDENLEFENGARETNHIKFHVKSDTHELGFKPGKYWVPNPDFSLGLIDYTDIWSSHDNENTKKYDIEIIDPETDFIRFAGMWGHDYRLENWADGPVGPMYSENNDWKDPWGTPF